MSKESSSSGNNMETTNAPEDSRQKPSPITIPNRPRLSASGDTEFQTPVGSPEHQFLIPSPMVTRKTRTFSASHHATQGPEVLGTCKYFSRSKGHGFVVPDGEDTSVLFMHVSDIDSEYIPLRGDILKFKKARIPPKNEKFQAVDVRIVGMEISSGKPHERWDQAHHCHD